MQEIMQVEGSWCYFCDGTELAGVTPPLCSHVHRLAARDPSRMVEEKIHNKVFLVMKARQPVTRLLLPALQGPALFYHT